MFQAVHTALQALPFSETKPSHPARKSRPSKDKKKTSNRPDPNDRILRHFASGNEEKYKSLKALYDEFSDDEESDEVRREARRILANATGCKPPLETFLAGLAIMVCALEEAEARRKKTGAKKGSLQLGLYGRTHVVARWLETEAPHRSKHSKTTLDAGEHQGRTEEIGKLIAEFLGWYAKQGHRP